MSNIFRAFRDYEEARAARTHRPAFSWEREDRPRPVVVETPEHRRAALARIRERYPALFVREGSDELVSPMAHVERLCEDFRRADVKASPALLRKFGIKPDGERGAEHPENGDRR
jgi:hypothetical protein